MAISIRRLPDSERNPLVAAVRLLSPDARRALYAAARNGVMRRGSWNGCAFSVAGTGIGVPVRSRGEAACAFGTTPEAVHQFIDVWDRLWGSNRHCTAMLTRAIEYVGMAGPDPHPSGTPDPGAERELLLV